MCNLFHCNPRKREPSTASPEGDHFTLELQMNTLLEGMEFGLFELSETFLLALLTSVVVGFSKLLSFIALSAYATSLVIPATFLSVIGLFVWHE